MLHPPTRSPLAARLLGGLLLLVLPQVPALPVTFDLAGWLGRGWFQLAGAGLGGGRGGGAGDIRSILPDAAGPSSSSGVVVDPNGGKPSGSGGSAGAPPAPGPH